MSFRADELTLILSYINEMKVFAVIDLSCNVFTSGYSVKIALIIIFAFLETISAFLQVDWIVTIFMFYLCSNRAFLFSFHLNRFSTPSSLFLCCDVTLRLFRRNEYLFFLDRSAI